MNTGPAIDLALAINAYVCDRLSTPTDGLDTWAKHLKLEDMVPALRDAGLTTIDLVVGLSEEEMKEVGLNLGKRKRLMNAIKEHKFTQVLESLSTEQQDLLHYLKETSFCKSVDEFHTLIVLVSRSRVCNIIQLYQALDNRILALSLTPEELELLRRLNETPRLFGSHPERAVRHEFRGEVRIELTVMGGKPPYTWEWCRGTAKSSHLLAQSLDNIPDVYVDDNDNKTQTLLITELTPANDGCYIAKVTDSQNLTVAIAHDIEIDFDETDHDMSAIWRWYRKFKKDNPLSIPIVPDGTKMLLTFPEISLEIVLPLFYSESEGFITIYDKHEKSVSMAICTEIKALQSMINLRTVIIRCTDASRFGKMSSEEMERLMTIVPEATPVFEALLGEMKEQDDEDKLRPAESAEAAERRRKELIFSHFCGVDPQHAARVDFKKQCHIVDGGLNSSFVKMLPLPAGGASAGAMTVFKPVATATAMNGIVSAGLSVVMEVAQVGYACYQGNLNHSEALWRTGKAATKGAVIGGTTTMVMYGLMQGAKSSNSLLSKSCSALIGGTLRTNILFTGVIFGATACWKAIACWRNNGSWLSLAKELVVDGIGQAAGCAVGTLILTAGVVTGPLGIALAIGGAMIANWAVSKAVEWWDSKQTKKKRKKEACLLLGLPNDDNLTKELVLGRFRFLSRYVNTDNPHKIDPKFKESVEEISKALVAARDVLKEML